MLTGLALAIGRNVILRQKFQFARQGPVSRIVKYESFVIYDFLNLGTFLRRSVIAFLEALRKWIRNFLIDDVIYEKILLWRPFVAYIVLLLRI